MLEQRQALIEERRKASIATKLQKESIAKVMEEVRTNASKASKIISKAMTGQISLESLTSTGGSNRSKSAGKTRKRSKEREVSSDSMGLERSQSAGNPSNNGNIQSNNEVHIKYSSLSNTAPQPYVSPYEMQ